jgi:hypothetical protein
MLYLDHWILIVSGYSAYPDIGSSNMSKRTCIWVGTHWQPLELEFIVLNSKSFRLSTQSHPLVSITCTWCPSVRSCRASSTRSCSSWILTNQNKSLVWLMRKSYVTDNCRFWNLYFMQTYIFQMDRQISLLKTYGFTTVSTLVFYVTFTLVDWTCTFTDSNASYSWRLMQN